MYSLPALLTVLRTERYDYCLYAMLTPKALRPSIIALLAFEWELIRIPHKVSEPMLGAIRFAWWQETLELLQRGDCNRTHPVIDALKETLVNQSELLPLLNQRLKLHQQHYEVESEAHQCIELEKSLITSAAGLIKPVSDAAAEKWHKKACIIAASESVSSRSVKLLFKLFFA